MAVVGEAHVVVRAITNKVRGDIRRGFAGADKIGSDSGKQIAGAFSKGMNAGGKDLNYFQKFSRGLRGLNTAAIPAYKSFASLQRKAYVLTTALGGLIGALNAVGGGIISLAGALGGAAPSMLALVQAMLAFKIAGVVGKMAMKGVGAAVSALTEQQRGLGKTMKEVREEMQQLAFDAEEAALAELRAGMSLEEAREQLALVQDLPPNSRVRREAELAYAEADLNLRRAIDRNKDVQDQLKQGPKNDAVVNAMKGLNQYQKAFAKFLAGINKKTEKLREVVSKGLLPPLQKAIDNLVKKGLPTVTTGFGSIAKSMGKASVQFSKMATTGENLKKLGTVFKGLSGFIRSLGKTLGNTFGALLTLLSSANPMLKTFSKFLSSKTGSIAKFLNAKQASGELGEFFSTATRLAGILGKIFGNLVKAFGGLIKAATGPGSGGEMLLNWIKDATERWKDFTNSNTGKLKDSLYLLSNNMKDLLGTVGVLGKTLISGLNTPKLGEAFKILREGAPSIGKMLEEAGSALPIFASLIVNALRFLGAFAESGAVVIFFDILNKAMKFLADIMEKQIVKDFLKVTAKVHAFALAFGLVSIYGGKAFDILTGGIASFRDTLNKVTMGGNPLIIMLEVLAGLIIYLYNTNEDFKNSILGAWGEIQKAIAPIMDTLTDMMNVFASVLAQNVTAGMDSLIGPLQELAIAVVNLLGPLMDGLVPAFESFLSIAMSVVRMALDLLLVGATALTPVVGALGEAFTTINAALAPFLSNLVTTAVPIFTEIVTVFTEIVSSILQTVIPAFSTMVAQVLPLIGSLVEPLLEIGIVLMEGFEKLMPAINLLLTSVIGMIAPLVEILVAILKPAFEIVGTVVELLVDIFGMAIGVVQQLVAPIMTLATALGGALTTVLNALIPAIDRIIGAFMPMAQTIIDSVMPIITTLVNVLVPVITDIVNVITPVLNVIASAVASVFGIVASVFRDLSPAITSLLGLLKPLGEMFVGILTPIMALVKKVLPLLVGLVMSVTNVFVSLLNAIMPAVETILNALMPVITDLINSLLPPFEAILTEIIDVINVIVQSVLPPLTKVFEELAPVIANIVSSLAPLIAQLVDHLAPIISTVLVPILETLGTVFSALIAPIGDLLAALIPIIGEIFEAIMPAVTSVVDAISVTLDALLPVFQQIIGIVLQFIPLIVGTLIPVITRILTTVMPLVTYLIQALLPAFTQIMTTVGLLVEVIAGLLVPIFAIVSAVLSALMPIFIFLIELLAEMLVPVISMLVNVIKVFVDIIMFVVNLLLMILMPAINIIIGIFALFTGNMDLVGRVFKNVWDGIVTFAVAMFNNLIGIFEGLINIIIDGINLLTSPFRVIIEAVADLIGFGDLELGEIPQVSIPRVALAKGGTVMPRPGGTIAQIAEAGRPERVVPLDSNGLSAGERAVLEAINVNQNNAGITVNVTGGEGMDTRELAAEVSRQIAFTMRKGSTA